MLAAACRGSSSCLWHPVVTLLKKTVTAVPDPTHHSWSCEVTQTGLLMNRRDSNTNEAVPRRATGFHGLSSQRLIIRSGSSHWLLCDDLLGQNQEVTDETETSYIWEAIYSQVWTLYFVSNKVFFTAWKSTLWRDSNYSPNIVPWFSWWQQHIFHHIRPTRSSDHNLQEYTMSDLRKTPHKLCFGEVLRGIQPLSIFCFLPPMLKTAASAESVEQEV